MILTKTGVSDQTSSTVFCSPLSHQISKIKVDDLQWQCNMSVCQYNTIRFYIKQNQKTRQKQYWPAINVSWTTFYVRPLICSIIVPTESTSPPQAKRGTEVIYFDIYIWFIKYTFAHLHYFYLLSPFCCDAGKLKHPAKPGVSPSPPYQLYVGSATPHLSKYTLLNQTPHRHKKIIINYVDIFYMRSHPEKQHLAWLLVTFLGDFSCLSWAPITCN